MKNTNKKKSFLDYLFYVFFQGKVSLTKMGNPIILFEFFSTKFYNSLITYNFFTIELLDFIIVDPIEKMLQ